MKKIFKKPLIIALIHVPCPFSHFKHQLPINYFRKKPTVFLTFIKVYNIIHEAQINTMDMILTIPIHNALAYTFTKHQINVN